MIIGLLCVFWLFQIISSMLFNIGGGAPSRWLPCFLIGNAINISSTWFLMKLYARMNPNLVLAITVGGSFLLIQVAFAVVLHQRPTAGQWIGFAFVTVGMVVASLTQARTIQ